MGGRGRVIDENMGQDPGDRQAGTSLGDGSSCPQCGTRVDWTRRWLHGTMWDRWPCRHCGRMLKVSERRRLGFVLAGSVVFACALLVERMHLVMLDSRWLTQATLIGVLASTIVAFPFLDLVEIAIDADPDLCSHCGYDLRVQRKHRRTRCPECGKSIPASGNG